MKGLKLLALVAIIAMALGITGAALAAPPPTGQDQVCPHDTDGWSSHQGGVFAEVAGADEYCAKGGNVEHSECVAYLTTGSYSTVLAAVTAEGACGLSHWSYHMPEYQVCSVVTGPVYGEWSAWSDWFFNGEQFERTRTRSITYYDSQDPEHVCSEGVDTEHEYDAVCPYNPELRAGDPECVPPPGAAGATLSPYCGGGINVTLDNASLYVQFGDQDPVLIDENGDYALALGDYIAWAEALEDYEFPEGAITRWEFTIVPCPTHQEEPPTGPLDSIPLSTALPIAGSGLAGLALLGSTLLKRKRH
jgi:hypothetical protein